MSTEQLIIPKICKAGFNLRSDTYSGRLAYVIYQDSKKKWRKEVSWEGWRQKEGEGKSKTWNAETRQYVDAGEKYGEEVRVVEFENVPTEGFVLNKKVGGDSSGWNHRSTYARVYDPRGWEFEVSIPNLLFILQETDCSRGKGLLGEFVYSWDGKDLVLLPCGSLDYQKSQKFTNMQSNKTAAKDLIPGATYKLKNSTETVYLGRMPFMKSWDNTNFKFKKKNFLPENEHVFCRKCPYYKKNEFYAASPSTIGEIIDENPHVNYPAMMEEFSKSNFSKRVRIDFQKQGRDSLYSGKWYRYFHYKGENLYMGHLQGGQGYYSSYGKATEFRATHKVTISEQSMELEEVVEPTVFSIEEALKYKVSYE